MKPIEKFTAATSDLAKAEENSKAVWKPAEASEDEFQEHLKSTAKILLGSIEKTANSPYTQEAKDLAQLTKAVCELQNTFFGKNDSSGTVIMTNQLSMFKGML